MITIVMKLIFICLTLTAGIIDKLHKSTKRIQVYDIK